MYAAGGRGSLSSSSDYLHASESCLLSSFQLILIMLGYRDNLRNIKLLNLLSICLNLFSSVDRFPVIFLCGTENRKLANIYTSTQKFYFNIGSQTYKFVKYYQIIQLLQMQILIFQLATVHVNIIKIFLIHRAKQALIINYTFHVKFMLCKMLVVIGESPLSTISGFSLMFLILVFIFVFSSDIDQFIFSDIIISEMALIQPFHIGLTY